jgi:hypothetical protein
MYSLQVLDSLQVTRDFGWTQKSYVLNVAPGVLAGRLEFEFLTGQVSLLTFLFYL